MRWRLPTLGPLGPRHQPTLGVDIGADGVRLVLLEKTSSGYQVEWAEEVSLTELQGFADYDSVVAKLQGLLDARIRDRVTVATVPPWNSARTVIEEMPAMDADRFAKAASWYFQRNRNEDMRHPVDLGIPQSPRRTIEDKDVLDGLMVSMDHVMIDGLSGMFRQLQLSLQWLLPAPLSYAHMLRHTAQTAHHALILDIGAGQSRMTLSIEGNVRLVRKLKPCANDLVRAISDKVGVGWQEANNALLAHSGLGPLVEDDAEGVAARAVPVIDRSLDRLCESLLGEIERSAAYVEARHGEAVDQVLLCGGLGGSPALLERLVAQSRLPISPFDPFAMVNHDCALSAAARPRFAMAVGVAIAAIEGDPRNNILTADDIPNRDRKRVPTKSKWTPARIAATAAAVGAVAGLAAFEVHTSRNVDRLDEEIFALTTEREELRIQAHTLTRNDDLFDLEDRIEALRGIYRSRRLFTPFFAQVMGCLPETMKLRSIDVERTVELVATDPEADTGDDMAEPETRDRLSVSLRGRTDDVDAVGAFVVVLEQQKLLEQIEVLRILEQQEEGRQRWFEFELSGKPIVEKQQEILAAAERAKAAERALTNDTARPEEVAR